ncbi:Hypothetical_protein [Hexamita inflata]|uniref:Hypothetical_protein n=1 Tax=Hexamita inflata TaxID=28002 RepID=A0AA86V053_9EUKA|nr:Hypothetical protein HINF_LOCUS58876 [Hexamita inflata]
MTFLTQSRLQFQGSQSQPSALSQKSNTHLILPIPHQHICDSHITYVQELQSNYQWIQEKAKLIVIVQKLKEDILSNGAHIPEPQDNVPFNDVTNGEIPWRTTINMSKPQIISPQDYSSQIQPSDNPISVIEQVCPTVDQQYRYKVVSNLFRLVNERMPLITRLYNRPIYDSSKILVPDSDFFRRFHPLPDSGFKKGLRLHTNLSGSFLWQTMDIYPIYQALIKINGTEFDDITIQLARVCRQYTENIIDYPDHLIVQSTSFGGLICLIPLQALDFTIITENHACLDLTW